MTADEVVSRELKSLHEELSAPKQDPVAPPADPEPWRGAAAHAASQADSVEQQEVREALGKFVDAVKEFVEEAEKSVSGRPVANIIGGIVVGIVIGRLLGRR
jgi:ElaB/YqjD/DUF883 family membrane-anchored ribosome-binding protein